MRTNANNQRARTRTATQSGCLWAFGIAVVVTCPLLILTIFMGVMFARGGEPESIEAFGWAMPIADVLETGGILLWVGGLLCSVSGVALFVELLSRLVSPAKASPLTPGLPVAGAHGNLSVDRLLRSLRSVALYPLLLFVGMGGSLIGFQSTFLVNSPPAVNLACLFGAPLLALLATMKAIQRRF